MLTLDVTGIDETSSSMRVLRTWSGSDMAGLGDDSLGTFLLLALNDQTQPGGQHPTSVHSGKCTVSLLAMTIF